MRIAKIFIVSCLVLSSTVVLLWAFLVPYVMRRELHDRLAQAGFAGAKFRMGAVTLDRIEFLDVTLARGLELGDIEIESGPYGLLRGREADVVFRHSRIAPEDVTGDLPKGLPFRNVFIEDGTVAIHGEQIAVNGSIDLRGATPRLALDAQARDIHVGSTRLDELAATIRGPTTDLEVCGTARRDTLQLDTCAHVRGTRIASGIVTVSGSYEAAGVSFDQARLSAQYEGDVATRAFEVHGDLVVRRLATSMFEMVRSHLPFAATLAVDERGIHVRAQPLTLETAGTLTLQHSSPIPVPALRVLAHGATQFGDVDLVAGDPADTLQLVLEGRGISLDRLLAAASSDGARGSGVLDGHVSLDLDGADVSLDDGELAARGPGHLAFKALGLAPGHTPLDLDRRIGATLADFEYAHLTLLLARDHTLHLALHGRGRRVPLELAIDVNVRGLLSHPEHTR